MTRGFKLAFAMLWVVFIALWLAIVSGCNAPLADMQCEWVTRNHATHCFCRLEDTLGYRGRLTWAPKEMCGS